MIAISGALVLVAVAVLVAGLVVPSLMLVYASIGMSLVSGLFLVVGMYAGRDQLFRRGGGSKAEKASSVGRPARKEGRGSAGSGPARKAAAKAGSVSGSRTAGRTAAPAAERATPHHAEVVVVPGRPRYHLDSCRQVGGRDTRTLELAEARDEGYVACTACRPDAVLAARENAESAGRHRAKDEPAGAAEPGDEGAAGDDPVVVVTGQRRYHRPGCHVVVDAEQDGAEVTTSTVAEADADGLTSCTVCWYCADG